MYDQNIISDYDYDLWGKRLIFLQANYPTESDNTPFMLEVFRDFSGTTSGFNLPLDDPWGDRTARRLIHNKEINNA